MQNRPFGMRGRSGYKAGFRGGRGFRGRGGNLSRGADRYQPRLRGGFRGRSTNLQSKQEMNQNTINPGISERPIRGGFRAFGRYRSKFDPVNHQSTHK